MTTPPENDPPLSPDGAKYWDGSRWLPKPSGECKWNGTSWVTKPPRVASRWNGEQWLIQPPSTRSEWTGSGWSPRPEDHPQAEWDGSDSVAPPDGGGAYRWTGAGWKKKKPLSLKLGVMAGLVAVAVLAATAIAVITRNTHQLAAEEASAATSQAAAAQAAADQERARANAASAAKDAQDRARRAPLVRVAADVERQWEAADDKCGYLSSKKYADAPDPKIALTNCHYYAAKNISIPSDYTMKLLSDPNAESYNVYPVAKIVISRKGTSDSITVELSL